MVGLFQKEFLLGLNNKCTDALVQMLVVRMLTNALDYTGSKNLIVILQAKLMSST